MTDTDQAKAADAAAKAQHEAAKKHAEDTKKKLAEERSAREKASKVSAKAAGEVKPTPTQEECDLAASGVYVAEHEHDGSVDPNEVQTKQAEANKPKAGYQTRAATPA
jgi:hypothetical protein